MTRGEEHAAALELATAELVAFIASCDDDDWATTVPGEGWSVAVLAHHCAVSYASGEGWLRALVEGEGVATTGDELDELNARHAERYAGDTRDETLALVEASAAGAAAYLRQLSDEQLEHEAPFGPAGGAVFAADAFAPALAGHPLGHLAHARSALGRS